MTNKELKKLNRAELLEILIAQGKENEELRAQLEEANQELQSKQMDISEAGSIAEAAIKISGVFDAAQNAAVRYLENIRRMSGEQDELLKAREDACRQRCEAMLAEAEEACRIKKQEADAYWKEVSVKLEEFYQAHEGLKEMLQIGFK